ncbi:MAG: AmmeMemoRadiSam system protein A [Treponema sp.]|jgi:AmmeMemoRadiSam system protein A/AmmeMemoRadiSam system protein B|nr:AmmeMemoRadiSam system protein A [Treponema sp.]
MKRTRKAFLVPHPPLIVPGVGKGDEIPATRDAYAQVAEEVRRENPETVVVISPHSVCYADYFHVSPGTSATGDFGAFRAPQIRFSVQYDDALADRIGAAAEKAGVHAGKLGERDAKLDHGVMVPLYFLNLPPSTRIIRVGLSGLPLIDHYRFGMCVREAADEMGRRVVLVASGDMSHKLKPDGPYGFAKEGPEHDAFVKERVEKSDFKSLMAVDPALCERAAECGFRSLVILAGFMDGLRTQARVLSYERPFGVGYLTAAFSGDGAASSLLPVLLAERKARLARKRDTSDPYVRLAIDAIERFVKTGKIMAPPKETPAEMLEKRAGVFVSVKKDGALRGCIGTIAPVRKNIALEIIENGVSAVSRDPRFPPVEEEELEALTYSVDILSPPESIGDPGGLDVVKYGVIVSCGNRRGLLLPNLDGVDSVEEQIAIALRKGGIQPHEPYALERFEVERHL